MKFVKCTVTRVLEHIIQYNLLFKIIFLDYKEGVL